MTIIFSDLPKIVDCKTNGTSLDVFIEDKYQIYDIERDFKITWWRSGGDQKETSFTKDLSFSIHYLGKLPNIIIIIRTLVIAPLAFRFIN
jgi:hypothetical protein